MEGIESAERFAIFIYFCCSFIVDFDEAFFEQQPNDVN